MLRADIKGDPHRTASQSGGRDSASSSSKSQGRAAMENARSLFCITSRRYSEHNIHRGSEHDSVEALKRARGGRGGGNSFVARLSYLIIDHASLSRREGGGREVYSISCMAVVVCPYKPGGEFVAW